MLWLVHDPASVFRFAVLVCLSCFVCCWFTTEPLFSLFLFFVSLCCFGCCLFAFICLFSKACLVGSCRVFISLVVDFCLGVGTVSLVSYCLFFSLYCIVLYRALIQFMRSYRIIPSCRSLFMFVVVAPFGRPFV